MRIKLDFAVFVGLILCSALSLLGQTAPTSKSAASKKTVAVAKLKISAEGQACLSVHMVYSLRLSCSPSRSLMFQARNHRSLPSPKLTWGNAIVAIAGFRAATVSTPRIFLCYFVIATEWRNNRRSKHTLPESKEGRYSFPTRHLHHPRIAFLCSTLWWSCGRS
jgi:hypothetical protein